MRESPCLTASVSMINRICGGENSSASKKKSRLEALAASRDRELGPDTDSEEELDKESKQNCLVAVIAGMMTNIQNGFPKTFRETIFLA